MKRYRVFQPVEPESTEVVLVSERENQTEAEDFMASAAGSYIEIVDDYFSTRIEYLSKETAV